NELSDLVSGISRQNSEFERNMQDGMRLTLIKTHPGEREKTDEGRITRYTLPLNETIGTTNPNNVYRNSKSMDELRSNFSPLIEEMAGIVRGADVVLLGGTYFVPWALLQAAQMERKPVVLCYAGILSMEINHLPEDIQSILRLMEKDFYDPRIFYIFPSTLTKTTVEGIFGKELKNSEVIFNGVPLEFLSVSGESKKEYPVAFVGRNTPVKNPEFLLELAKVLDRKMFMVTQSEESNKLIRNLRKAGVVVLDPMDTDSLARFYRSTGVVLTPSRFETYGNVPLEAVSTGTPAIISNSMGVREVFDFLGIGSYVDTFRDARVIAEKVEALLARNERIPESIRIKIREKLSWYSIITRYH